MTQENFIAGYKALQAKKQKIDDRMSDFKEENLVPVTGLTTSAYYNRYSYKFTINVIYI